jgi:SNF2 family DNA or RNA helicase
LSKLILSKNFLVVCPSSLVGNWGTEFDKWIGKACEPKRVVIRSGGEQAQQDMQTFCQNPKGQVLILSYDLFRRNSALVSNIDVSILVVDEGHRLKNKNGSLTMTALQTVPADARLCLTATPVQNNLVEFHSLVNFTCPGLLGDLATFVKEFDRPITKAHSKNATVAERKCGEMMSAKLEKLTESFVLRRLQKDVLKTMLPARTEALLFCRPTPEQCDLYQSIATAASNESEDAADSLTSLIELRKVCIHPCLVNAQFKQSLNLSGKLLVLDALLRSIRSTSPDDKVVVVSNFTSMLSLLETSIMQPMGYTYSRLDGSIEISRRQGLVDDFNRQSADSQFCFLLSSKAGGCGLNLIGANRLILVDNDWNPATDIQAMGRVYRQGQTKPCTIYRLITSGTIEEVIYQRQSQKERLAAMSVDSQSKGKFTKEELADCFTLKRNCPCDTKRKVGDAWPTYEGRASLQEWDCDDEPLLEVSEAVKEHLGFVHIVDGASQLHTHGTANSVPAEAPKSCMDDNAMSTSEEEFSMSDDDE